MQIVSYSRMNTRIWPGLFLSTIAIGDSGEALDKAEVVESISRDRDSIDAVAASGSECDLLSLDGVFRIIKDVSKVAPSVIAVTDGSDPAMFDDLVGAGYVDRAVFTITGVPERNMVKCISIADDMGCEFMTELTLSGPVDAIELTRNLGGSRHLVIKVAKGPDGKECLKKKEVEALAAALKGRARDVRFC